MNSSAQAATSWRYDRPLRLAPLVYLEEGDEVTVGRPDTGSFAILPPDGAALTRYLAGGATPAEAAAWYERGFNEPVDVNDFIETLDQLGFLLQPGERVEAAEPVRWQKLGKAVFSPVAWIAFGGLVLWCLTTIWRSPDLMPKVGNLFFTTHLTVIELSLFAAQVPLLLLHEAFHALAARRLGLRSSLSIGRRLYFVVFETALDGLVAVARKRRYLPMLAGMVADVLAFSGLTLAASLSRDNEGSLTIAGRMSLAFAFATLMRLAWQFYFYLRTDLYYVVSTVLGCADLQPTAKQMLYNRFARLLGRRTKVFDESSWHPADRKAARWYSWLMLAGYTFSVAAIVWVLIPATHRAFAQAFSYLAGAADATSGQLVDSVVFLTLNGFNVVLVLWLAMRDRRLRQAARQ